MKESELIRPLKVSLDLELYSRMMDKLPLVTQARCLMGVQPF